MKSIRRTRVALVVIAMMLFSVIARAQVLDQVPEQALVVVKVTNLGALSQKFGKLATDLQLVALAPPMADPLSALQEKLKITNGLDKAGDAAFVFLDPAVAGGDPENSMLVLWPVADYKAFISNWGEAKEENGIAEITLPDSPKPAYFANWGKYAVMSPSKEIAALKPKGIKATGMAAKELTTKDIVLYANMAQLKAKLQPALKDGREKIMAEMDQNLQKDEKAKPYIPVLKVAVNQLLNVADSTLRDATSATVSVNIGDAGISSTVMAEFAPDSYLGNLAKGIKNTDASLLTGIPAGKYLFYGGSVNDSKVGTKVFSDLISPIEAELQKVGNEQSTAIGKYVEAIQTYIAATESQAFGVIAPSGALGQEPLLQVVSVQQGDAAAMKSAYQQMMTTQEGMMKAFGTPQDAVKMTNTPNGKTVDGVTFDTMTTEFNMNGAGGAGGAQAQMMMTYLYGPNGMTTNLGVVGNKLVMAMGASDATISSTIAAVKGNEDPLSKTQGVATVAAQLPKNRIMAAYIPLDELASTIGAYAAQVGAPFQIQLPPDLPPIGATIATEGNAIRIDSYTPTDLVKALVAQGMQIYMQMQGARGGGGGGL